MSEITGRNRTKTGKSHSLGFAAHSLARSPHAEEPRLKRVYARLRRAMARRLEVCGPSSSFETRARPFRLCRAVGARAPRDEDGKLAARRRTVFGNSHLTMSNSPSRSRGAYLRPGFATLLHSPRIEGWAERRETFGCSAEHPWGVSCASKTRVNALMTRYARRLARRLASHDAGRSPLSSAVAVLGSRGRASAIFFLHTAALVRDDASRFDPSSAPATPRDGFISISRPAASPPL